MKEERLYIVTIGNWKTEIEASQHTRAKQLAAKKYREEVDNTYPPGYLVDCASARVAEVKSKKYKLPTTQQLPVVAKEQE